MSDRTTSPVVCLQSLVGDARVDPSVVEDRPRRIVQRPNRIVDSRHCVGGAVKPKSRLVHQCHFLYENLTVFAMPWCSMLAGCQPRRSFRSL